MKSAWDQMTLMVVFFSSNVDVPKVVFSGCSWEQMLLITPKKCIHYYFSLNYKGHCYNSYTCMCKLHPYPPQQYKEKLSDACSNHLMVMFLAAVYSFILWTMVVRVTKLCFNPIFMNKKYLTTCVKWVHVHGNFRFS